MHIAGAPSLVTAAAVGTPTLGPGPVASGSAGDSQGAALPLLVSPAGCQSGSRCTAMPGSVSPGRRGDWLLLVVGGWEGEQSIHRDRYRPACPWVTGLPYDGPVGLDAAPLDVPDFSPVLPTPAAAQGGGDGPEGARAPILAGHPVARGRTWGYRLPESSRDGRLGSRPAGADSRRRVRGDLGHDRRSRRGGDEGLGGRGKCREDGAQQHPPDESAFEALAIAAWAWVRSAAEPQALMGRTPRAGCTWSLAVRLSTRASRVGPGQRIGDSR